MHDGITCCSPIKKRTIADIPIHLISPCWLREWQANISSPFFRVLLWKLFFLTFFFRDCSSSPFQPKGCNIYVTPISPRKKMGWGETYRWYGVTSQTSRCYCHLKINVPITEEWYLFFDIFLIFLWLRSFEIMRIYLSMGDFHSREKNLTRRVSSKTWRQSPRQQGATRRSVVRGKLQSENN